MHPEIKKITCPNCSSKKIKKTGIKKNLLQRFQKYQCIECKKVFILQAQTKKQDLSNKNNPNCNFLIQFGIFAGRNHENSFKKIQDKAFTENNIKLDE